MAEDALPETKKRADESSEEKDERPEAAIAKAETASASDATKGKGPSVSHVSIAHGTKKVVQTRLFGARSN